MNYKEADLNDLASDLVNSAGLYALGEEMGKYINVLLTIGKEAASRADVTFNNSETQALVAAQLVQSVVLALTSLGNQQAQATRIEEL